MHRISCILIGYIFGNFLTAVFVSRYVSGKTIFEQGSGNPGMRNVMILFGGRAAAWTLIGDMAKTFAACLLCRLLFFPGLGAVAAAYAGLGTILGHNFPWWHRLRGGKGVACTCVALFCISPLFGLIVTIIGGIAVQAIHSRGVSAVLVPGIFLIPAFIFYGWEIGILVILMTAIMVSRHFELPKKKL